MSTRSQIEFKTSWKDQKGKMQIDRRTVYRHWDGYPEGVIPDLTAFLKWNGGAHDTEYTAANFLFWSKRKMEEENEEKKAWREMSDLKLGFGVCENDEIHEDTAYFYVVEQIEKDIQISIYKHGCKLKDRSKVEPWKIATIEGETNGKTNSI